VSGASFVLAINLFVAGLFAAAFFLVAASSKTDRAAIWFGIGYLCGFAYFLFEFLLPLQVAPKLTGYLAFVAFLAAMTTLPVGLARRYRYPVPVLPIVSVVLVSLVVNWFTFELPRPSLWRLYAYQLPYALLPVIGVGIILAATRGRRRPLDYGLIALFLFAGLHFLAKPLMAQLTGGPGSSAQSYIGTQYALYSQSLSAVISVMTALVMLMVLIRDMLDDATTRSETDPLSGLFNRRGFEERAEPGLAAAGRGSVPATYVACDLDHFKLINDSFGHDAGDEVIRRFAGLLRAAAPPRAIVARIGGEEFAVFLPDANVAAGRLYAETVRMAFATLELEGVRPERGFSASFGVAESIASEALAELRRRADAALYTAKQAGRDRVVLAAAPGLDAMPAHPFMPGAPRRKAASGR
jgi:diguanylate cyclase (GGDEF)-like protein